MQSIEKLLRRLRESPGGNVFNPWYDRDPDHDADDRAPKCRRENLAAYLQARVSRARFLFVAEAVGFRGGKFSGIAMTCERQLPATDLPHHRTSVPTLPLSGADQLQGVLEPTAMIVARTMAASGVDPHDVVLWNTFAWHPHQPGNRLTNRTPTPAEVQHGLPVLHAMLELCSTAKLIAIGKTCQRAMTDITHVCPPAVRHPANGGATEFARGVREILMR